MRSLIIGLGNPGQHFAGSRHNIGFQVVDALARELQVEWRPKPTWCAEIAEAGHGVLLVKPTTFMNDSGRAVRLLAQYYDLSGEDICVIYDDRDITFGSMRWTQGIRTGGSHNGVRSILKEFGADITRLRIGIGNDVMRHKLLRDFVLASFTTEEKKQLGEICAQAIIELRQRYLTD